MNIDKEMLRDDEVIEEVSLLAKKVIINFFTIVLKKNNQYTPAKVEELKAFLDNYKVVKNSGAKNAHAKCNNHDKKIMIFPSFMYEEYHEQLFILVHEYIHAVSSFVVDLPMPVVIEEGFAEALAEIALNIYVKKENIEVKIRNKSFEQEDSSYKPCAELIKTLLAISQTKGKDYELIYNYFFKHKSDFCNYFEQEFGHGSHKFLTMIDYIDPLLDSSTTQSIRKEIDGVFRTTMQENLSIDEESIDKSSKKGLSDYYYHNLLLERYIFQNLQEKYMDVISFNKFIELLKKFKPISRSSHFECPELDGLLKVFYFPNMHEFSEVLNYVKVLPQDLGVDLLSKKLERTNNKMITIIAYSGIIRNFNELSHEYLKYYDKSECAKTKFEFLLKVLDECQTYDSYYYYELVKNCPRNFNSQEREKLLSLIITFVTNNVLETDQEYTIKLIANLPTFVKKLNISNYKFVNIYKKVSSEIMLIIQSKGIHVLKVDTESLNLEIDFTDLTTADAIYNLIQREDIIYFKKYLIKGLKEMLKLLPKETVKKFDKI